MSISDRQKLMPSDIRRERKELLLCLERGNKADIHTYSSGHLGPHSFSPIPFYCQHDKSIWEDSKDSEFKLSASSCLQESRVMEANVEGMMTTTLQEPETHSSSENSSNSSWMIHVDPYKTREVPDATELFLLKPSNQKPGPCVPAVEVNQGRYWCTHSYLAGLSRRDQLQLWKQFDRQVVRRQDLITRNCLRGSEAAERHERNLKQELRKVPACRGPCRERLMVFSDVFSDVCDNSPVLGSILREIKTEYELYLNFIICSQSSFQDMSAFLPLGAFFGTVPLEEAARQVTSLEEKARRALEENDRVRAEYEDAQAKAKTNQREKGMKVGKSHQRFQPASHLFFTERKATPYHRHHRANEQGVFPDVKHSEAEISATAHVEFRRRQVWRMWKEVQSLQKEIRERMVSTVTICSLEGCIREAKAEMLHLVPSNKQLRSSNKDIEQSILTALHRTKVDEETKVHVWEKIWTTVNGDD